MDLLLIGGIVVAIGVIALALVVAKRNNRTKTIEDRKRNQWIIDTLRSITAEADRKRLNIHATPKIDMVAAFSELTKLAAENSTELVSQISEIENRWKELNSQLAEFGAQSTSSTLQSSLLTNKTSKLANDIGRLASEIEGQLDI